MTRLVADQYTAIRGKCTWWRESENIEDSHDIMIKAADKRIDCVCFVEGRTWTFLRTEVPSECPENLHCRYYIKNA